MYGNKVVPLYFKHENSEFKVKIKMKRNCNTLYLYFMGGVTGTILLLSSCNSTEDNSYKYTSDGSKTEYACNNGQYVLPVICHVFFKDKKDSTYIPPERIAHIFSKVNDYYKENNINVTFELTMLPPSGKGINYPGVEYVSWPSEEINENDVMGDAKVNAPYKSYLWDPNRYINVMFYAFKPGSDEGEYITLGVSHMPLTYEGDNKLEGLKVIDSQKYGYLTLNNINYAPCSSINSTYAYEESTANTYNTMDVTVTVAHELGHYLGLLHAFTENAEGEMVDSCSDTDHCKDTPSYDRLDYMAWLTKFAEEHKYDEEHYLEDYAKRYDCEREDTFISHNIMDYFMSFTDELTPDQRKRINNVLEYSPLMPKDPASTRSASEISGAKLNIRIPVIKDPFHPMWKMKMHK